MVLNNAIRPLPELDASSRIDPEPNRNYGIEVIKTDASDNPAFPLQANYRGILGSCRFCKLTFAVYVSQVQSDVIRTAAEQFCHLSLSQPDSVMPQSNIYARDLVRLVDDDLVPRRGGRGNCLCRFCAFLHVSFVSVDFVPTRNRIPVPRNRIVSKMSQICLKIISRKTERPDAF